MPREIPVIAAEKILQLHPDDVRLAWGTSTPNGGLKDCEVRIVKAAAAAAGFDLATITGNIHPTTSRGTRSDKPHLTVKFRSTRYNPQTEQTVHINVHVWNPATHTFTTYPRSGRPPNFPYHHVVQDGSIRFYRPLPRKLAHDEIVRRQAEEAERKRLEEEHRKKVEEEHRKREAEEHRRREEERRRREHEEHERKRREEEHRRRQHEEHERRRREEEHRRREHEEHERRRREAERHRH